jgi:hypothetical protein
MFPALVVACGVVYTEKSDAYGYPDYAPAGTCFAFGDREHVLTASHCIPEGETPAVWLSPEFRRALRIDRCPGADVALITIAPATLDIGLYAMKRG